MNLLEQQLERLQAGLRATHVALLVYAGERDARQIGLFHAGEENPAPELVDLEAAASLISGSLASRRSERFASRDSDCQLISIPTRADDEQPKQERRQFIPQEPSYWIGVRGVPTAVLSEQLPVIEALTRLAGRLFALESQRADPQTGLPDRAEFERALRSQLSDASNEGNSLTVFIFANESAKQLPTLLQLAIHDLNLALRDSDQLYRYALDQLALIVPGLKPEDLELLGDKIQRALTDSLPGQSTAGPWSVAAVRYEPEDLPALTALEFSLAAETVLRQCLSQGRGSAQLEPLLQVDGRLVNEQVDPALSVVFSGEPTRDYRHMRLLWDTVNRLGEQGSASDLAADMITLLNERLGVGAALLQVSQTGAEVLASTTTLENPVSESLWQSLRALPEGITRNALSLHNELQQVVATTSPQLGAIHLLLEDPQQLLCESAYALLVGLSEQITFALERLTTTEQELSRRSEEATALRRQVQVLSQRQPVSDMTFTAPAMTAIVERSKAWARTEEIVLITGESGSGKEVFAQRIHQASARAEQPLITVDCASIPPTLIEAELFGRIKGAYTGADSAAEGYVRKAEGGTLFLDEIGELPLESQSKLLRLLQERQVSPVGSADVYQVDVRIIAATNRDLATEVNAGRFRADLMYRLKVLELELPPLRERREDIEPLCQHFLAQYNAQYERACTLTPAALNALCNHRWPGNVRELKHCMLKACLQAGSDEIQEQDLGLLKVERAAAQPATDPVGRAITSPAPAANSAAAQLTAGDLWQNLELTLRSSCGAAIDRGLRLPIGNWLGDAFLEAAYNHHDEVAKHAAHTLGLAESTFRRQHDRLQAQRASGLTQTHDLFVDNLPWIHELVILADTATGADPAAAAPLERAKKLLLDIVSGLLPQDTGFASALMGVTPPTYRRHLQELREAAA